MEKDYFANGLDAFSKSVRSGDTTFEAATRACIKRIHLLNPSLGAFECVDGLRAIDTATGLDQLLANGTDLGPLMGVCIAAKDIIVVEGLPTTNGSLYVSDHINGSEGTVIKRLKAAGCVIVGKTKTVEFALGATGINEARGTPWNPWDAKTHRIPGGSSSGSAVAVAAGLCGFALGTDTGGSIRIPACYNGLFGHKTTVGLWPTDGVFPLSPTLDSIGPLCRTASDAAVIHNAITGGHTPPIATLNGMRFGKPKQLFFDDLDPEVHQYFETAVTKLQTSGVTIVEVDLPQAAERETLFPPLVGAEIIAALTPDGFKTARAKMDSVTGARAAVGLDIQAHEYVASQKRLQQLKLIAAEKLQGLDALISPTCLMLPAAMSEIEQSEVVANRALMSSRNTQPANLFGWCASSLPMQPANAGLPAGFQLMMPGGQDDRLLAVSIALEQCLRPAQQLMRPDLSHFVAG